MHQDPDLPIRLLTSNPQLIHKQQFSFFCEFVQNFIMRQEGKTEKMELYPISLEIKSFGLVLESQLVFALCKPNSPLVELPIRPW